MMAECMFALGYNAFALDIVRSIDYLEIKGLCCAQVNTFIKLKIE